MNDRDKILERLTKVKDYNPSGDQVTLQNKELQSLQVETLMELIKTLDKIDTSNKKLEDSNLRLSWRNLWLQVFIASISVIALLVALFYK